MPQIQASSVNTSTLFNLNGLDFQKGVYTVFYDSDVRDSTTNAVDATTLRVGLKNRSDGEVFQHPLLVSDWVNSADAPYTSLDTLLTDLSTLVGFDSPQVGGVININQGNASAILGGDIDSSLKYFIESNIDMGLTQIDLSGGKDLNLGGYNFNLSGLFSTEDNHSMIIGADAGDILFDNLKLEASGANSRIYDLTDLDGTHAIELDKVNYINCTEIGNLTNYRQGLEVGTGRLGGSPSLCLAGAWAGGFRITTSIVRGMSSSTTAPLFKKGIGFVMQSRFLTDINCDLGTLQPLLDFDPSSFPNPSTLEIKNAIITRDGLSVPNDSNITPNISASDLSSSWKSNNGIPNTFIGGIATVSTEVLTTITGQNVPSVLLGTITTSDLQHFDSPTNGQLRHLGDNPREYTVSFDFVLEGQSNNDYKIELVKDNGSTSVAHQQIRVINNSAGGRDVAYFTGVANVILNKSEFVYWQVTNLTGALNCTLVLDSTWAVKER